VIPREGVESTEDDAITVVETEVIPREGVESERRFRGRNMDDVIL